MATYASNRPLSAIYFAQSFHATNSGSENGADPEYVSEQGFGDDEPSVFQATSALRFRSVPKHMLSYVIFNKLVTNDLLTFIWASCLSPQTVIFPRVIITVLIDQRQNQKIHIIEIIINKQTAVFFIFFSTSEIFFYENSTNSW